MKFFSHTRFLLVGLAVFVMGCSGGEEGAPELHPVSGKLTVGGSPVENVQVSFVPADENVRAATGNTDTSGQFTLASPNAGPGAMAGQYKVVLTPGTGADASAMESQYATGGGDPAAAAVKESPIPKEYLKFETSTKLVEVKEGENEINLEL